MMDPGKQLVVIKELLQISFEDLDPYMANSMWDADGSIHVELLEIVSCFN
jgi:hypothetical protein